MNPMQHKNLPRFRLINSDRHYFALVNSQFHLRYLLFDDQQHVFYNHSSLFTDVHTDNSTLLSVTPLFPSYSQTVAHTVNDKRFIDIYNLTGIAYIRAETKGYLQKYVSRYAREDQIEALEKYVQTQLVVEVVRNVDIQPKYKAVYLAKDNSFRFKVLHGSGHFSVSLNNTDIADKHYIDGERTVTIYPKKEGPLEIKVEDIELPDAYVAVAELLVSDVHRLELDSDGTLVEQAQEMELNVTAYDYYGREFDLEQYTHMKFHIEIEIS